MCPPSAARPTPMVKFVAGIDHITPSDTGATDFSYRIVAIREGKELDHIVVRSFAWGFEEVTNAGNLGLKNVDDIILLNVPCVGGCGCSTGEVGESKDVWGKEQSSLLLPFHTRDSEIFDLQRAGFEIGWMRNILYHQ